MNEPTHLDLFSGIGGFALAAKWAGFKTIGFCEIDKYCRKVLAKNFGAVLSNAGQLRCYTGGAEQSLQGSGTSGQAWISDNIFELEGHNIGRIDLITGGFPCQPFSVAGKRRGAADDRAIWPEMFRVISEARPAWVLGENVPGIIPMELDNVLSDLEGIGYSTRAFVIPACAVDARHRRDRVWIVANANEERECGLSIRRKSKDAGTGIVCDDGDSSIQRLPNWTGIPMGNSRGIFSESERPNSNGECRWIAEPDVGRVAHGIPSRVDRLKGLGNAIVPQVAYEILREIRKLI